MIRMSTPMLLSVALAGLVGLLAFLAPEPCAACPPADAYAEWLLLELESVEVDGSAVSPPPAYAGVRIEVIQSWADFEPKPLVLIARDTATLYQAYFQ